MNRAMWDIHKERRQDLLTEIGAFASPGSVSQEVRDNRLNEPRKRAHSLLSDFDVLPSAEFSVELSRVAAGRFNLSKTFYFGRRCRWFL